MTTACPRFPRDEQNRRKKQQTGSPGEDKKEKRHKLTCEYAKCTYFGLKHERFPSRIHLTILKL